MDRELLVESIRTTVRGIKKSLRDTILFCSCVGSFVLVGFFIGWALVHYTVLTTVLLLLGMFSLAVYIEYSHQRAVKGYKD